MRVIVPALVLLMGVPCPAGAEWVLAVGEQVFPPSMSEAEACRKADELARADAIRQVAGERVSAQDWMQCTETDDQPQCLHNAAIWVDLGGTIRTVRHHATQTVDDVPGYRRCVVRIEADVAAASQGADPAFNLGVQLNHPVFREGELLALTLTPTQPMWVQVFQWLPGESASAQVRRLFPNDWDKDGYLTGAATVPGPGYDFKVVLPSQSPHTADEYLLLVASRTKLALLDQYSLNDFSRMVAELSPHDSRLIRRAYTIVRER